MLLPFSQIAKRWEPFASDLRKVARVPLLENVDPWKLAVEFGLHVLDGLAALEHLPSEVSAHLIGPGKHDWSGGVHPDPLEDGTLLCILNPFHSRRRNKVTLMEEISHILMDHVPSGVSYDMSGLRVRDYHEKQEKEAYGIGSATLIPWQTLLPALKAGKSVSELAETYDVSTDLINYRIKITAGSRLYKARERARKSK